MIVILKALKCVRNVDVIISIFSNTCIFCGKNEEVLIRFDCMFSL